MTITHATSSSNIYPTVQMTKRNSQLTMVYHLQKSLAIAVRKQDIMREISHCQHPKIVLDQNHYRWNSPWTKPRRMHQPQTLLTQIGFFWEHAQPPAPSGKSFTKNPTLWCRRGTQGIHKRRSQINDHTATLNNHPLRFFKISNPSQIYSPFWQWRQR